MSGSAKPCHGIVDPRLPALALLLLAVAGCVGQRSTPPAAKAATPSPLASAAVPDGSELRRASLRLIGELRSPLWLDLYASSKREGVAEAAKDTERLLRRYERAGKGKLKLTVHQMGEGTAVDAAREAGMVEVEQPPSADPAFLGIALRYEGERAVIPSLPLDGSHGFEFWVTNKMRELRDRAEHRRHRIGVVTGKSEIKLSDPVLAPRVPGSTGGPSIERVLNQAFPFYALEPVDLQGGKAPIDPGLIGLIVTQPGEDYTPRELQRIDDFMLLGGKGLAVFASAVNLKPGSPQLQATLDTHRLEKLLHGYGIDLETDVLWDHASPFALKVSNADGQPGQFRYPPILLVHSDPLAPRQGALDASAIPFFRLERLAFPHASSLRLDSTQQPADVVTRAIARTTDTATSTRTSPVDLRPADSYPRDPLGKHIVAATVQGRLRSAFPVKFANGTLGPIAPTPSRVLVIASSTYLTNPFVYANSTDHPDPMLGQLAQPYLSHLTATIVTVKNTLDWMLADDDFVELSATIVPSTQAR